MNSFKTLRILAVSGLGFGLLTGCLADWRTTPTTVDHHHGMAVKRMIAEQTLNPANGQQVYQSYTIDGPKSEGNLHSYRALATDLRQGKEKIDVDIDQLR